MSGTLFKISLPEVTEVYTYQLCVTLRHVFMSTSELQLMVLGDPCCTVFNCCSTVFSLTVKNAMHLKCACNSHGVTARYKI